MQIDNFYFKFGFFCWLSMLLCVLFYVCIIRIKKVIRQHRYRFIDKFYTSTNNRDHVFNKMRKWMKDDVLLLYCYELYKNAQEDKQVEFQKYMKIIYKEQKPKGNKQDLLRQHLLQCIKEQCE